MAQHHDIKDFAERVSRMCEYFLAKVGEEGGRRGSADIIFIEKLKEEADSISFDQIQPTSGILEGLDNYIRGFPKEP